MSEAQFDLLREAGVLLERHFIPNSGLHSLQKTERSLGEQQTFAEKEIDGVVRSAAHDRA